VESGAKYDEIKYDRGHRSTIRKNEFIFDDTIDQIDDLENLDAQAGNRPFIEGNTDTTINTMLVGMGDTEVIGDFPEVIMETPAEAEEDSDRTPGTERTSRLVSEFNQEGIKYGPLGLVKDSIFVGKITVRVEENLNEVLVHKDFRLSDPGNGDL